MTVDEIQLLEMLQVVARKRADGHLTVMRFTTNWRVGFATPDDMWQVYALHSGSTFAEAAIKALTFAATEPSYLPTVYSEIAERVGPDFPRDIEPVLA